MRERQATPPLRCLPPFSSYSHWMPPHWSPPRPCLPAGVPLTFNLWHPPPPVPQNSWQRHQLNLLSGDRILRAAVMTTGRSDSEYRCSSHQLLCSPLLSVYSTVLSLDHRNPLCGCHAWNQCLCVCMSWSHLSWCSWVKEKILLFFDGELPATQRSSYNSAGLSSLLKKHVPALCTHVGKFHPLLCIQFISNKDMKQIWQLTDKTPNIWCLCTTLWWERAELANLNVNQESFVSNCNECLCCLHV